jgi:hypothetical protein
MGWPLAVDSETRNQARARKVLRSLPARGGVYCAGDLSGSLADAGG